MSEDVNYSNINANIKSKHSEFIQSMEGFAYKVSADSLYNVERNSARLTKIFSILKDLKVIDSVEKEYVGKFQRFKLLKEGFGNWCEVLVSEDRIVFGTSNFQIVAQMSGQQYEKKIFYINDTSDWWNELSLDLLDYIHSNIYERKRVADEKISSMLGSKITII